MEVTVSTSDPRELLRNPLVMGLLDSVSDGALIIDAKSREVLAMNARARGLLGYAENEPVGCQCRKMMNSPACTLACPLTALLEGRSEAGELDLYYRGQQGDQVIHAHTRMLLVRGPDGDPIAGIELFTDTREVQRLRSELVERRSLAGIIGVAPAMQSLFELVEQIAPFDIPVLITGESGVGKERFAEAIHQLSQRSEKSMVVVNCAALSPSLVESELFGHRRGSFTGATSDRRGRFEEANGGTLLLDEIGDLPLELQPKLLRALQEGEIQRVGEDRPRQVDVRVLAATNRRLEDDVAAGRFRQDLYFRLLGARVHIPPLRERREDIPPLCDHLLAGFYPDRPKRLSDQAAARLLERDWPGNVRELANVLRLAAIRAGRRSTIEAEDLVTPGGPPSLPSSDTLDLAEVELRTIERALQRTDGNLSAAARLLGIDRTTLWRKLKR